MKRAGYRDAIDFIAFNDEAAQSEEVAIQILQGNDKAAEIVSAGPYRRADRR